MAEVPGLSLTGARANSDSAASQTRSDTAS
jgi:hypothetical protein